MHDSTRSTLPEKIPARYVKSVCARIPTCAWQCSSGVGPPQRNGGGCPGAYRTHHTTGSKARPSWPWVPYADEGGWGGGGQAKGAPHPHPHTPTTRKHMVRSVLPSSIYYVVHHCAPTVSQRPAVTRYTAQPVLFGPDALDWLCTCETAPIPNENSDRR